jgi:hypothetical protein
MADFCRNSKRSPLNDGRKTALDKSRHVAFIISKFELLSRCGGHDGSASGVSVRHADRHIIPVIRSDCHYSYHSRLSFSYGDILACRLVDFQLFYHFLYCLGGPLQAVISHLSYKLFVNNSNVSGRIYSGCSGCFCVPVSLTALLSEKKEQPRIWKTPRIDKRPSF